MKDIRKFCNHNRFLAGMLIAAIVMAGLTVNTAIRYNDTRAELAALTAELENLKSGLTLEQKIDAIESYIDNVQGPVIRPIISDRFIYVPDCVTDVTVQ